MVYAARTSGLKYWCASSEAATKLRDKMASAIRNSMAWEESGAPQKNVQVAYKAMCTRKRNVWMMETAIGILARTPGEERAGDCAAALSSGVVDSVTRVRCAPMGFETQKDHEYLVQSFQPGEQLVF